MKICSKCKLPKEEKDYFGLKAAKDGLQHRCRKCQIEYTREQRKKDSSHGISTSHVREMRRLKWVVMSHYSKGDPSCACCGVCDFEFLGIDHIEGGGNKHRKEINKETGHNFYRWLRTQSYPEGFRVLCHNCNQSYGNYGYCPHELKRQGKLGIQLEQFEKIKRSSKTQEAVFKFLGERPASTQEISTSLKISLVTATSMTQALRKSGRIVLVPKKRWQQKGRENSEYPTNA